MQFKSFINKKNIKRYHSIIKEINEFYKKIENDNTLSISEQIKKLKEDNKLSVKKKIIQSMAWAKRASKETLGMTYYDVQLMGALALFDGCMAEMKTGEGKTLTCSAAVVANYVLGYKTHVATANEYLAQRDEETLRVLYAYMGISSFFNISNMSPEDKRAAYNCDVLYSTAQELGFDYLRDNLVYSIEHKVQPTDFKTVKSIIDEADFVLIDEARTPLIISGLSPLRSLDIYQGIKDIISKFKKIKGDFNVTMIEVRDEDGDFWLDEKQKNVYLSEQGYTKLENETKKMGFLVDRENKLNAYSQHSALYNDENSWIINEAISAIKAQYLYIRDKDYVVHNGQIVIIDPNTGRLSEGRTWSNGLHQAIETKENVQVYPETLTLGSISIQNFFRVYASISGMSGTIMNSSEEFEEIYNCKTIQIPTNKPIIRKDHEDQIYLNTKAKYNSILNDIKKRHQRGQPILIGTTSVSESEIISDILNKNNISHNVLNAKNNALEAQIIAQAGQPYAITVATSMAGRGTDIILGGNKELILGILDKQTEQINERINYSTQYTEKLDIEANVKLNTETIDDSKTDTFSIQKNINELYDEEKLHYALEFDVETIWNKLFNIQNNINKQKENLNLKWNSWKEKALKEGGLVVIGTSRNESRRIDDQLKGRAGRQGDPGESIFYMSTEDSWVNIFGQSALFSTLTKSFHPEQVITSKTISKVFAKAQRAIESQHFNIRKNTFQYDSITDEGRREFLRIRNDLLANKDSITSILKYQLEKDLSILYEDDFILYVEDLKKIDNLNPTTILEYPLTEIYSLINSFKESDEYQYVSSKKKHIAEELEDKIESFLISQTDQNIEEITIKLIKDLDEGWIHHLSTIEEAEKNVGFRSLAQKNPIQEYKKLCFESFSNLIEYFQEKLVKEFVESLDKTEDETNEEKTLNIDDLEIPLLAS